MVISVKSAITVMLIIHLTGSNTQSPSLEFLNKLLDNVTIGSSVETMLILQHHQDRNCELQDWNRGEIPSLRFNQLAKVQIRGRFNFMSMGLVCIGKESDLSLLDTLAEDFDGIRQERIVIWIQMELTRGMLQRICDQANLHQYLQVLILEVSVEQREILSTHYFVAFPHAQIVQVDKSYVFHKLHVDFKGRTANVLPDYDAVVPVHGEISGNVSMPLRRKQDSHIILFARKYNLKLKVIGTSKKDNTVTPDIQLSSQMTSGKTDIKNLNPFDLSALMVVVPCSKDRSFGDILKQLDMISSLLYILPVYATFVVVETIILYTTHRINGRAFQLTNLNPFLNLRAFRAILGMPFPISRRANLSLRQLFLAISVFGLIFSNFFSCKLTALLTKHPHHPQVKNFRDLRASDLTVIVSPAFRTYIENEVDPNFFKETISRVSFVTNAERTRLLFSLNESYAYVVLSDNFGVFERYQKSLGRKVLCDSKDLTIAKGMPRMHVLQKNSLYDWPLSQFLVRLQETGIMLHWIYQSPNFLHTFLNTTPSRRPKRMEVPLCFEDLSWLWFLLVCGYGLATFVFIVELALRGPGDKRAEPRGNVLVI